MKKFSSIILLLLLAITARAGEATVTGGTGGQLHVVWSPITNGVSATWTWTPGSEQVYWEIEIGTTSGAYNLGLPNGSSFPGGQSGSGSYTNPGGEIWFEIRVQNNTGGGVTNQFHKVYPPGECKIKVRLQNTRQIPVSYKLMKKVGETYTEEGDAITLQPGETAEGTIDGLDCAAEYKVISRIEDFEFTDGQWFVEEEAIVDEDVVEPVPEAKVVPESEEIAEEDVVVVPEPQNAPGAPVKPSDGSSAWKPAVESLPADLHTNTVHREGIDKLTTRLDKLQKSIDGEPVASKNFDQTPDPNAKTVFSKTQVTALAGKIPSAPSVTAPTSVSSFSFTWATPGIAATTPFEVDFAAAHFAGPIAIFKTLVRAGMSIAFFFLTVRAIRSAFTTS